MICLSGQAPTLCLAWPHVAALHLSISNVILLPSSRRTDSLLLYQMYRRYMKKASIQPINYMY